MAWPDVAADVVAHLASAGLSLVAGTNLFSSPVLPAQPAVVPESAVFVFADGGAEPLPYLGVGKSWFAAAVRVRVRWDANDRPAGQAKAAAVLAALHCATISGYDVVRVQTSSPIPMARDENGCHNWTFTVRLGCVA